MSILKFKVQPEIVDIGEGQHLLVLLPEYDPATQTEDFTETVLHLREQLKYRGVEILHEPNAPTTINIVGSDLPTLRTLRMIYHVPEFKPAVRKADLTTS